METKKFKIVKGESRSRGGFNNTKTTLSAAGISAIGGAAAGAAFAAAQKNEKPEEEVPEQEVVEQDQAQVTPEEAQPAPEQPVVEQPEEPITEPQPVDNPQTETVSSTGTTDATDDIPEEIAEAIIKDEIDNQDIDGETVISQIDGFSTAYGPDGSEVIVAIIHSPDGTEFLLADMDGDGVFSEIFTTDGEFVGSTETTITAGDLVEMADPSGGYLAMEENLEGADPTEDIVNIDGSEVGENENENSMAQTETDDEVSVEELLAQITDSEMDDDDDAGTLIDDEETDDDSDDDSDEDDENTDDDDE